MKYVIIISMILGTSILQNSAIEAKTSYSKPIPCPKLTLGDITNFLDKNTITKDGIEWHLAPQNLAPVQRTKIADIDGTCSYEDGQKVLRFKLVPTNHSQPGK